MKTLLSVLFSALIFIGSSAFACSPPPPGTFTVQSCQTHLLDIYEQSSSAPDKSFSWYEAANFFAYCFNLELFSTKKSCADAASNLNRDFKISLRTYTGHSCGDRLKSEVSPVTFDLLEACFSDEPTCETELESAELQSAEIAKDLNECSQSLAIGNEQIKYFAREAQFCEKNLATQEFLHQENDLEKNILTKRIKKLRSRLNRLLRK